MFWLVAAYVFVGVLLLSFSTSHDMMAKPEEYIRPALLRFFCQSRDLCFLILSLSYFSQHCRTGSQRSRICTGMHLPSYKKARTVIWAGTKWLKPRAHSLVIIKLICPLSWTHDPWSTHSPVPLKKFPSLNTAGLVTIYFRVPWILSEKHFFLG